MPSKSKKLIQHGGWVHFRQGGGGYRCFHNKTDEIEQYNSQTGLTLRQTQGGQGVYTLEGKQDELCPIYGYKREEKSVQIHLCDAHTI